MWKYIVMLKYRSAFSKCKKAAIEFLIGYKCLTENGRGRVIKLIEKIKKLYDAQKDLTYILIEDYDLYDKILRGLNGFLDGNEAGFEIFEKNDTINKIKKLINIK